MTTFDHERGRTIDVDGARIYAEAIGADDMPTLVLLHGGFGNMEDFDRLLPSLEGWRVIGIDSRGHGKSTLGDGAWTYQRVQQDTEQVLAALGVRRCTLLGFSDGGIAALRMGASPALTIDRIVVAGATWHHKNLASSKPILQGVTAESWKRKFPQTFDAYQRLNPAPDFERFTKALVKGWLDETPSGHPDDRVTNIQAPVLVVRGDDDHLTSLEDAVELRQKLPDGHFLGIPFAGHVAFDDAAEVFVPALRGFLEQGQAHRP
ncbi:alpha/beta fold hydrolase [Variovorax sp. KK3]|uniref:alpha/beta fold hydrolase n=1 Tax=Variovorax sp. KK3 TaxID=1855728 RepID=UPI00097BCDFB|nr:alpha/beta hydrolase [Variovorax sp. KK3]